MTRFLALSVLGLAVLGLAGLAAVGWLALRSGPQTFAVGPASDGTSVDAIICAPSPCLFVRAGGFHFLFGAGAGAAQGLAAIGAPLESLDGVFLTDLGLGTIAGLAALRDHSWKAGRKHPLILVGPSGIARVAEGLNAMLEIHDAEQAVQSSPRRLPFRAALVEARPVRSRSGHVVFDSGLLRISAHDGGGALARLLYRLDYRDTTFIIAGCGVTPAIWRQVTEGQADVVAVAAVSERTMTDGSSRQDASGPPGGKGDCPSAASLVRAVAEAGVVRIYAWPLDPQPWKGNRRFWQQKFASLRALHGVEIHVGSTGMRLNLGE